MRVAVTVSGIKDESAGPSYTVPSLCRGLARRGVDVSLHFLGDAPQGLRGFPLFSYKHSRFPLRSLGRSPGMLRGLVGLISDCDIVHNNGIWMMPNVYPAIAKKKTNCKLVFSPRGGLSSVALSRSPVKKFLMGHLCGQYMALRETDMFHAASMKELQEIRALGYAQPIALVPNGIDVPKVVHKPFEAFGKRIVFFGRIHETKAADHLLAAWGNIARDFPEWSLDIAGPDCGAVSSLKSMIADRGVPRVSFIGELHGLEKHRFLASADLYVLPSLTENFGITIAEALACGTPVVASRGCPWSMLDEKNSGWWIDVGVESLTRCLESILKTPPERLREMGENGRRWMVEDYSWDAVCEKMNKAYEWLCHGGAKPEFVYA